MVEWETPEGNKLSILKNKGDNFYNLSLSLRTIHNSKREHRLKKETMMYKNQFGFVVGRPRIETI